MQLNTCAHELTVYTEIDRVCVACGLVVGSVPFDNESALSSCDFVSTNRKGKDITCRHPRVNVLARSISEIMSELGVPHSGRLVEALVADDTMAELGHSSTRKEALARVYSHLKGQVPLVFFLTRLKVSRRELPSCDDDAEDDPRILYRFCAERCGLAGESAASVVRKCLAAEETLLEPLTIAAGVLASSLPPKEVALHLSVTEAFAARARGALERNADGP